MTKQLVYHMTIMTNKKRTLISQLNNVFDTNLNMYIQVRNGLQEPARANESNQSHPDDEDDILVNMVPRQKRVTN